MSTPASALRDRGSFAVWRRGQLGTSWDVLPSALPVRGVYVWIGGRRAWRKSEVPGVLIVAKITKRTAGGYAEYLEGKARASELGDYYLKDGERVEAPGRWVGGADLFGLDPDCAGDG